MKLVLLFAGGRAGSDLLQSLLDGHKEVAQFPAVLHFTDELLKIFKLKDPNNIAKKFISKAIYHSYKTGHYEALNIWKAASA